MPTTTAIASETDDYMGSFWAFLQTQPNMGAIGINALRSARAPAELGMTSLGVITLLVNYLETNGVPGLEFNPDWISRLESVQGIVSVCHEIDRCRFQRQAAATAA